MSNNFIYGDIHNHLISTQQVGQNLRISTLYEHAFEHWSRKHVSGGVSENNIAYIPRITHAIRSLLYQLPADF